MRSACGSRRLWLGMAALRALAALAMVGGLGVASARVAAAQVEGDTFTAQSYDWSITWDDSIWAAEEETNGDGYDYVQLFSEEYGAAYIEGYTGFDGDPAECLADADEQLEERDGVDDLTPADDLDTPSAPPDAEASLFTYTIENDGDLLDLAEYTECRPLVEGEAVFELTYQTLLQVYEDGLPIFEELLDGLEVGEADATDGTDEEDEDEEEATEEAEDDRDTSLGDDEEDEGDAPADSGIDGDQYESPTYGYSLEWDDSVWEADADAERVDVTDDFYEGLDRLVLRSDIGSLWIEGQVAYEGDPELCLEEEADLLANEEGIEEFELLEDEDGDPLTGETDDGGFFGAYAVVYLDPEEEDAEEFELIDYVECRELVEGEAVLVITFVTGVPEEFAENFELVEEVLNAIELDDDATGEEEEAEEEETEEAEEEATEEPEEEATEEAEEEETEEAEEEETEEAEETGGVDGNTYLSPAYGYGLEWDDAVWTVDDESSSRGVDTLILESDFGVATFVASDEFAGDQVDCYDDLESRITDDFPDLELLQPEGEDPLRGSDESGEFGFYSAMVGSDPGVVFLQCSPLADDDGTLAIHFIGPGETAIEGIEVLEILLAGLETE